MTENEKLRALLEEAREVLLPLADAEPIAEFINGIDATLAEPSEQEETEHAMHMRIRTGYDKTIADAWRAKVAEVERERDEARARCEKLRELADMAAAEQGLAQRRMMEAQQERDKARAEALPIPEDK
jgi:hypothetical protein